MKYRYREPHEMKDSGVEWLKKIPHNWKSNKLNRFYSFEKGVNSGIYTKEYISTNEGKYPVYSGQTKNNGIMGKINSYDYNLNCLFTTTVGAQVMTPMKLKGKFSLSQNCLIMKSKNIIDNYIFYQLFPMFKYEKSKIPSHIQPSLRIEDLNTYKIIYPHLKEQQKIADFLDEKTSEFDSVIEKKEKLIKKLEEAKKSLISEVVTGKKRVFEDKKGELKVENRKPSEMKDSGVEWLGMIPEEWEVKRIKYFTKLNFKTLSNNEDDEMKIRYIDIGSVKSNGKITDIQNFNFKSAPSRARRILSKNDTIISTVRTYLKAISYFEKVEKNMICSTGFAVFSPILKKSFPKFFYYSIKSEKYINEISKHSVGVSYPAINASEINNFKFIFPKLIEQKQIANFLDKKTSEFDSLIEKNKKQIEKIKEAKQSLISEAVTGKIEVL